MNTCSIRSLKNAFIGQRVRMSSDKSTVPFDNIPMKNIEIVNYSSDGFQLKHQNFPKEVWVDFEQLPLTRLSIKNGIIEDELTFVENIVMHKMQLIKTYDTEYIDMLYAEAQLKKISNKIIKLSNAIPGNFYKSAVCKDAVEMVYLGTFYTKNFIRYANRSYYHDTVYKNYLNIENPKVAFFAVKTVKNKKEFFEIASFASSNKMIKELICLPNDSITEFSDVNLNLQNIFQSYNNVEFSKGGYYKNEDKDKLTTKSGYFFIFNEPIDFKYKLLNNKWGGIRYISLNKPDDLEVKEFIEKTFNIKLENELVRGSSSYNMSFTKTYIN